ncbi:L-idonate 5-dehydrogenase [Propionibacterium sp.]|uniref:L-idonate 5-dehydrogenase n=1 Tax=Propionibacterium sp. TaxID=1977903 RepID=UPI0039E8F13A
MKSLKILGKNSIRTDEVDVPEPKSGEVLLHMLYGGICGSDLHYYFNGANGEYVVREPLTPGHEMSGTVESDPSGKFAKGTPVTVAPATYGPEEPDIKDRRHLWAGGTYLGSASTMPHTQGGMSEYLLVKDFMVRPLPDGLDIEVAALAEPLSVGLHAINIAGGVEGKKVLVSGSGPIGLLCAAACVAKRAKSVTATDVLDGPLSRAKAVGVDETINISQAAIPESSYDVVFECSGVPAASSAALAAVRKAGTVVQVGMLPNEPKPINLAPFLSKEVTYLGCFRFNDEIDEAVKLLASDDRFESVITHVIPADDAVHAFEVAKNSAESGKVLISLWIDE